MTPTELTHRARRAYALASNEPPGRCSWDELPEYAREQYLAFADHLLADIDDYRQLLLRIHQFAKPIVEWTEPVFRQEVRRRELEAPKPIAIQSPEQMVELYGFTTDEAREFWKRNNAPATVFCRDTDETKKPTGGSDGK